MMPFTEVPTPMLQAFRAELGPRFVNEQQRAFFYSHAAEILYSGAYRAGKSRIGAEKAWDLAMAYPGIPIGVFRKYASSLAPSTERTLVHDVLAKRGGVVRSNRTERWYEFANGSRIWLFGLDPDPLTGTPSKVGSVELGWAFVDEAAEVTQDDWGMIKGRLSWPGIPYHQIAAATNPAHPAHWLKQRFTPPSVDRMYLHASTFDNPELPADYLSEAAASGDDFRHRRYHLGEWVAAEGAIWTLADEQIRPAAATQFHAVHAGIDWGFVHAFACEVLGQSGTGRLAVLAEVYEHGATVSDLIPALAELRERYNIEAFYADPSEPGYIYECQRAGLPMIPATNDVLPGITAVTDALARGMTVDPSCAGLLAEMPGYTWMPARGGGLQERPIEINDDACDALRYAVMSFGGGTNPFAVALNSAGGVA